MFPLYLAVNAAVLAIPFMFSWHPRIRFVDEWHRFAKAASIVAALFIVWDIIFAARGVWGFSEKYLIGADLFGLPLEEWLFFVCIPYACVFTYFVFSKFDNLFTVSITSSRVAVAIILLGSLILLAMNFGKWYTVSASTLSAMYAAFLLYKKPAYIGWLLFTLAVLVFPFVITNGVLTGLRFWEAPLINLSPGGIADQIVWYDNNHNVAVRILTIPVEDFLYAFVLVGTNISLFEYFGKPRAKA